jgi:hypothetical protein
MTGTDRHRGGGGVVAAVVVLCAIGMSQVLVGRGPSVRAALTPPRTVTLIDLKIPFGGAAGCADAKCHGTAEPPADPKERLANQNAVWKAKDRHAKAFESLTGDEGKAIAQRMGIAATDARCTKCHTIDLDAPQSHPELKGAKYLKDEGVTCTACHGPDAKWQKDHQQKGWVDQQRQKYAGNSKQMLSDLGLYDTKSPLMRAEMCTSCHLAIDAEMISKGKHPQPKFEIEYYSTIEPKHWQEPNGAAKVRRWIAGQAACVRDAMRQLAERAKGSDAEMTKQSYEQAVAHLTMLGHALAATGGAVPDAKALQAAMTANNMASVGAEAEKAAAAAEAVFPTLDALNPATPAVVKLLNALASDTVVARDAGAEGMDQQVYAMYAVYAGYATMPGATADRALAGKIRALFKQPNTPRMPVDQFLAAVAQIKQALPQQ